MTFSRTQRLQLQAVADQHGAALDSQSPLIRGGATSVSVRSKCGRLGVHLLLVPRKGGDIGLHWSVAVGRSERLRPGMGWTVNPYHGQKATEYAATWERALQYIAQRLQQTQTGEIFA